MPPRFVPPPGPALDLEEVIARLEEGGVDLSHPDRVEAGAALLAGLAQNPDFLGDRIIAALKQGYGDQANANRYSAQVFLLHRSRRRWYMRANMWPAERDAAYIATGPRPFAYDLPHDHHFTFLTVGYFGPGYVSDYYEWNGEVAEGLIGEDARLRFTGRHVLSPGTVMLYRAHRDVHRQLPPASLSVSLNIMEEGEGVAWRDQYIFDLDAGRIVERPTISPTEMLLRAAVHVGANGIDLADQFARSHPVARARSSAFAALAGAAGNEADRRAILERGLSDPHARVRADCASWLELA